MSSSLYNGPIEQANARGQRQYDQATASDEAWAKQREWLISVLLDNDDVCINKRPVITLMEVEYEMERDEAWLDAIRCCNKDETGAGALLGSAKRNAINKLIDQFEPALRDDFERQWDEHYARGAA